MAKGEVKVEKEILKENELFLPTGEYTENNEPLIAKKAIRPTKLRYMLEDENKSFLYYSAIEETLSKYGIESLSSIEAIEVVKNFLVSVFDDKKYVESILGDLDVDLILDIVRVAKKVNKIKSEDEPLKNVMENLNKEMV
jgi:tryptophanase